MQRAVVAVAAILVVARAATTYYFEAEYPSGGVPSGLGVAYAASSATKCAGVLYATSPTTKYTKYNWPSFYYTTPSSHKWRSVFVRYMNPSSETALLNMWLSGLDTWGVELTTSTTWTWSVVYYNDDWGISIRSSSQINFQLVYGSSVIIDRLVISTNDTYDMESVVASDYSYTSTASNVGTSSTPCVDGTNLVSACMEAEWPVATGLTPMPTPLKDSTASNGFGAGVTDGTGNSFTWSTAGYYEYKVTTTKTPTIAWLNGRFIYPSTSSNAIWVAMNSVYHQWSFGSTSSSWSWLQDPTYLFLKNTNNSLRISNYYDGTLWDKFYLGSGTASTCVATVPSKSTNCNIMNGNCDPLTTCTSSSGTLTCSSCPYYAPGNSDLTKSSAGCVSTLPSGCYVTAPSLYTRKLYMPTTQFTIGFSLMISSISTSTEMTILQYEGLSSSESSTVIVKYSGVSSSGFLITIAGVKKTTAVSLSTGTWAHVVIEWVQSTGVLNMWVNGVNKYTVTDAALKTALASPGWFSVGSAMTVTSGVPTDISSSTYSFSLDNLEIYSTLKGDWASMLPPVTKLGGLEYYWTFDCPNAGNYYIDNITSLAIFKKYTELGALQEIYRATTGTSWYYQTGWSSSGRTSPCSGGVGQYYGLDCNSANKVTALNLAFNNLNGVLPCAAFCSFPSLQYLFLQNNKLYGSLLGILSCLPSTHIYLFNNKLSGSIPAEVGSMSQLIKLYLENNTLNGQIPSFSSNTLQFLGLTSNSLSGSIPTSLASVKSLNWLDASGNALNGLIPKEIINSDIDVMSFKNNSFYGQLPDRALSTKSNVTKIDMAKQNGKGFSCMLPPWLRNSSLTISVDVTGGDWYCPTGSQPAAVTGIKCTEFVISSLSITSVNLDTWDGTTNKTVTITGSGFKKDQCGSNLIVKVGSASPTLTVISDTSMSFPLPYFKAQWASVKVLWNGQYYNGLQMGTTQRIKYFKSCPNNCTCPSGNCQKSSCQGCCKDEISGVCVCKAGFIGADCSMRSCPLNCSSHGTCNYATGNCTCVLPYYGKACNQAFISCPNDCSGHGACDQYTGVCICQGGFWGKDCRQKTCPPYNTPYCSNHGTCNGTTGNCSCADGWVGVSCSIARMSCPNDCSNSTVGICDPTTGKCTCRKVGNIQYSGEDCSSVTCTNNCSSHGKCNPHTGLCECVTPYIGLDCSTKNISCNNSCSGHGTCDSSTGKCSCESGFTGAACNELSCPGSPQCNAPHGTCNHNTGVCICEQNTTVVYQGIACLTFSYRCPNDCYEPDRGYCDPSTGSCSCKYPYYGDDCTSVYCPNGCSGHGQCNVNGTCICDAYYGAKSDCSVFKKPCADSCNSANGGGTCDTTTGLCSCNDGWADGASGFCTKRVCINNCNYPNGNCQANGTCSCSQSYTGTSCSVANLACPNNCNGHGTCNHQTGTCVCYTTYEGASCSIRPCYSYANCSNHGICNLTTGSCNCNTSEGWLAPSCAINSCSHLSYCGGSNKGICNKALGVCECKTGFFGGSCQFTTCGANCSGHGDCNVTSGKCNCFSGWQGKNCSIEVRSCPNDCNGHGTCNTVTGQCSCKTLYYGDDCSYKNCLVPSCNGNGRCVNSTGECECFKDWTGSACNVPNLACPLNCSGHGTCNKKTGICICHSNYYGKNCSEVHCTPACLNGGVCNMTTAKCDCPEPYSGAICAVVSKSCPNGCSGHGRCLDNSTCSCWGVFQPPDCSTAACPDCGKHGRCDNATGSCVCDNYFSGKSCQLANIPCVANCSGHGVCKSTTGECMCSGLYLLPDCYLSSCPQNCSGHGTCDSLTGTCSCLSSKTVSYTGKSCQTAVYNCTKDCGAHGSCNKNTGLCKCDNLYWGDSCQYQDCPVRCSLVGTAEPACKSYDSSCRCKNGTCACIAGEYTGETCSERILKSCPGNCSGYECNTLSGICNCPSTKTRSASCNETSCPNKCSSNGNCDYATGTCECFQDYYGTDCRYKACPNNCTGNGRCSKYTGVCLCYSGYTGANCSQLYCEGGCNEGANGGSCVNGVCKCKASYTGLHCRTPNYLMIILVAAGGGTALVGGSTAGFFLIRRAAIKRLQSKRATRMRQIQSDLGAQEE